MNKRINKKIKLGLAHGVFDILHVGHIEYFKKAKTYCDKLMVSVTKDKFVNKGPNRPAFKISERVKMLKSIKYIDQVMISKKSTSVDVIKKYKPDFYFKGKDYEDLVLNPNKNLKLEMDTIKKNNGKFLIIDTKLKSSSKILNENTDIAKKIFSSCVHFPEITGGTNSANCILTKLSKGRIFFKNGAEGVFLALIPEIKSALVVKIIDGAARAAETAIAGLISELNIIDENELAKIKSSKVKNSTGQIIGKLRSTL